MFNKLIQYLSILAILGFLISYAYINAFYKFYNIEILNYITYSEIMLRLAPLPLVIISMFYAHFSWFKFVSTINLTKERIMESKIYIFLTKYYKLILGILLLLGIFILILMIKSNMFLNRYSWLLLIIVFLTYIIGDIHNITAKGMNVAIFIFSIFLIIKISESLGRRNADIKFNNNSLQVAIQTSDGSTITTSDSLIIIDETQAAIFLCSKKDTSIHVINRSEIKSIHYK